MALPAGDTLIVAEVRTAAGRPGLDGFGPHEADLVDRLRLPSPDGASVWGAVWSPRGDRVAALTTTCVLVAAVASGPGADAVVMSLPARPAPVPVMEGWSFGDVRRLAFDATGHRVAVLTSDPPPRDHRRDESPAAGQRTIQVWDTAARPALLWSTPVDAGTVGVTFADGDRAVIGFGPDVLDFHDATTGRPRGRHLLPTEHDASGHPLTIEAWNYDEADLGAESFLLPARGDRTSWCWASSFHTGLVRCPAQARPALAWHPQLRPRPQLRLAGALGRRHRAPGDSRRLAHRPALWTAAAGDPRRRRLGRLARLDVRRAAAPGR